MSLPVTVGTTSFPVKKWLWMQQNPGPLSETWAFITKVSFPSLQYKYSTDPLAQSKKKGLRFLREASVLFLSHDHLHFPKNPKDMIDTRLMIDNGLLFFLLRNSCMYAVTCNHTPPVFPPSKSPPFLHQPLPSLLHVFFEKYNPLSPVGATPVFMSVWPSPKHGTLTRDWALENAWSSLPPETTKYQECLSRGCNLESTYPIYARILSGLIMCRSCVGSPSYWKLIVWWLCRIQ